MTDDAMDESGTAGDGKTNPWDDVETARRPSQRGVDLPSPGSAGETTDG